MHIQPNVERLIVSVAVSLLIGEAAQGQCSALWRPQSAPAATFQEIDALAARDPDGAGPIPADLFVGGTPFEQFGGVAQWSASNQSWLALGSGTNGRVRALISSGANIFVGGQFTLAGGAASPNIARWTDRWSAMGPGLPGLSSADSVLALAVLPDQSLVASYTLGQLGAISRWNGQNWEVLGAPFDGRVNTLAVHNGDLFAGGRFGSSGGTMSLDVARWDGSAWQPVGQGLSGEVFALKSSKGLLFAGRDGGGRDGLAAWNGQAWQSFTDGPQGTVRALEALNNEIVAGGEFIVPNLPDAGNVVRWNGAATNPWRSLLGGATGAVFALTPVDTDLAVGGVLTAVDGQPTRQWARWHSEPLPVAVSVPIVSTFCRGSIRTATISVTVEGNGARSYQWRKGGIPVVDAPNHFSGARTSSLTVSPATYADSGPYDCVVADSCASPASAPVELSICFADFNCQGGIDVSDLYTFLSHYFAQRSTADVNGHDGVTLQDVLDFVAGYIGGC